MPSRQRRRRPGAERRTAGPPSEPVELTIEALGARGDGIARHAGTRVFVPFVLPGERVRARLGDARADGIAADLIEVVAASPARRMPACAHFGNCGGCQIQHMAAEAEAAWKTAQIADGLAHHGITGIPIRPIATVPAASRRRTRFVAVRAGGTLRLGYHARQSHDVVDIAACPILEPDLARLLPALRALAGTLLPGGLQAGGQQPGRAAIGLVLTRLGGGIDLAVEADDAPDLARREALARFAEAHDLVRIAWLVRGSIEPIAERRPPNVVFAGVAVAVPPAPFLQASAAGEAAIVTAVLDALGDARHVADLYAGLGTLAFAIAARARVHAVEGNPAARDALAAAARRSGYGTRITTEHRDLARDPLSKDELARFDAVVFDPPRAGAKAQSEALSESVIKNAVAVSCNPSTFARDARILIARGMTLDWVQPIDQFVWSARVELVASFKRKPA
jgi:23S rRNA (uracil1939-C5)-methyltransferase